MTEDWTPARAEALAADVWGVRARARPLSSERDTNFRLDPLDGGGALVLKISHPDEAPDVTAFQSAALLHARTVDPGLPVPAVVPTLTGAAVHRLQGPRPRIARMVGWLYGAPLADAPASAAFRGRAGALLARLDRALDSFSGAVPGFDGFVWDLSQAAALRDLLPHVTDDTGRRLAARALDGFANEIAPRLAVLRRQVIHNDLNPHNILVSSSDPDRPAAIIDFCDMMRGPLVNELAIALAYQPVEGADPLAGMAEFARGYTRVLPLLPDEIALLPGLIAARRATTVAVSSWRAAREPANRAYLERNLPGAITRLAAFAALPAGAVMDRLSGACAPDEARP